ncbi:MAG: inorganic pyrophosphatase [Clostridia bacterium]|nr:inorganic pyrophosphatase [Clostridia bacterium]
MEFRKIEEFEKLKKLFLDKDINKTDTKSYIGKTITAKIDRQMGSKHPQYGFIYPINYGYIPNTISGDGEELDCYILGIFEPVESFTGKCIAVIHRLNDNDDKLVLVPENKNYTNTEIRALTEFQERFFESIIMN